MTWDRGLFLKLILSLEIGRGMRRVPSCIQPQLMFVSPRLSLALPHCFRREKPNHAPRSRLKRRVLCGSVRSVRLCVRREFRVPVRPRREVWMSRSGAAIEAEAEFYTSSGLDSWIPGSSRIPSARPKRRVALGFWPCFLMPAAWKVDRTRRLLLFWSVLGRSSGCIMLQAVASCQALAFTGRASQR